MLRLKVKWHNSSCTHLRAMGFQLPHLPYHIIISYCMFLMRQFRNTGAAAINRTSRFSAVLQMFPETVSGHECRLASCSRCVDRRRQMICHTVQFLSAERRASKYQLIACQDDGCRPGNSTQLNTLVHTVLPATAADSVPTVRTHVSVFTWHCSGLPVRKPTQCR